jgi:Holliday junction resolvase RusA-like endonuclease
MNKYLGEKFKIPYPQSKAGQKQWAKEYGMNAYYAGKHWSRRKRDAEFWHMMVRSCMNSQNVRRDPFKWPVVITFRWNDRLDIDNHAIMGKMIVDAMKGRVIEDDNRRCVKGVSHYFHDEDYIGVEIREIQ